MNRKVIVVVVVVMISVAAFFIAASMRHKTPAAHAGSSGTTSQETMAEPAGNEPPASSVKNPAAGRGLTAIKRAAETNKYLFAYFYRVEDEQTRVMKGVFDAAMSTVAGKADSVTIDITEPSEKGIVDKFGLGRAPMPIAMVVAPNGAITGAFPSKLEEKQLAEAIVSPCTERCLKALQERKLVFLCVQNDKTKQNDAAMRGVMNFKADARFAQATEIITVDPAVEAEGEFLEKLKINPGIDEALTVFLAPPGRVIGTYNGATDKAQLEKMLLAVMSSCGSGCGPSGCGPKK
ncbi:MAG TPA: hypothetical protein VMX58_01595 [Patescibacteria group bacterium]|nr:hypothetical protein [Patescibacteria group bacterium]